MLKEQILKYIDLLNEYRLNNHKSFSNEDLEFINEFNKYLQKDILLKETIKKINNMPLENQSEFIEDYFFKINNLNKNAEEVLNEYQINKIDIKDNDDSLKGYKLKGINIKKNLQTNDYKLKEEINVENQVEIINETYNVKDKIFISMVFGTVLFIAFTSVIVSFKIYNIL